MFVDTELNVIDPLTLEGAVTEQLEHEATTLVAHLSAATCRWLLVVAELDRREAWASWGCRSMVQWLSWRCGIVPVTAREHLRVAHALRELPAIRTRFAAGEVSYSKVRAMVRVANPANEDDLLNLALFGTAAQLEQAVRVTSRVKRSDDERDEARMFGTLQVRYDEDGHMVITAVVPPEEGAVVLAAIDAARAGLASDDSAESSDGPPLDPDERLAASRARGLAEVARRSMAAADLDEAEGERIELLVVADESGCHLDHGPALSDETARRLACEASVVLLRTHDGQLLDIGRKSRTPPRWMRRAMRRRDGGCRFPGCGRRSFTQAHHLVHWTNDGPTSIDNLVELCWFHHRLMHEGGWTYSGHPGRELRFHSPDGGVVSTTAPSMQADGPGIRERNAAGGLAIDHRTAVTGWMGDRLDLDIVVEGLLRQPERPASNDSAESSTDPF